MNVAGIVLAAGGSARMGQPKQALRYRGNSLLHCAVEAAIVSGCNPVYAVLGAHHARLSMELSQLSVRIVSNVQWGSGMGTSIRRGVQAAVLSNPPDAVVLMLADQPLVSPQAIQNLFAAASVDPCDIAASAYSNTLGAPALFMASVFDALLNLHPAEGARKLIRDPRYRVLAVPLPEAAIDIDTPEDYRRLTEKEKPCGV